MGTRHHHLIEESLEENGIGIEAARYWKTLALECVARCRGPCLYVKRD